MQECWYIETAQERRINDVRRPLDAGDFYVDIKDYWGNTVFIWAANYGHKEICELLISQGSVDEPQRFEKLLGNETLLRIMMECV